MHRSLLSAVLSLSVLFSPFAAAQDAEYTFTVINTPPGSGLVAEARGINTAGQIVGHFGDATGRHGFLTDGTTFTTIDVPDSGAYSTLAHGINTMGQIVGYFEYRDAPGRVYGFLKEGATFTIIDVPGATDTYAAGINMAGQIVGWFDDAAGRHGFLKEGDTFITFDAPGSTYTEAYDINTAGHIVGWFRDGTGNYGFLTPDGSTFTTIDAPGARVTQAQGINTTGEIVGWFNDGTKAHGFLTPDGSTFTIIDAPDHLGTGRTELTAATGINDEGEIVGWFRDGVGATRGFLATPVEADTTPPVITVSASPATLSPPNGRLVTVTVSGAITDEGSGVEASTYQVIGEYGQIQPKGNVPPVDGSYTFTVALQASRRGNDRDGRRYTIEVSATDNAGNEGSKSATVIVPRK
jgi:probable HAF family extracellular repeat protein